MSSKRYAVSSDEKALLSAAKNGDFEALTKLLKKGVSPNVHDKNFSEWTPLHYAADKGSVECINALLQHGADVNAKDKWGGTPLHYASSNGKNDCVVSLIQGGADVNAKANNGWTPLHRASMNGQNDCVVSLIQGGADVNSKTNNGKTPLDMARSERMSGTAKILEEHMQKEALRKAEGEKRREEERKRGEEEKRKREEEERRKKAEEEEEKRKREAEEKRRREEEERRKREEEVKKLEERKKILEEEIRVAEEEKKKREEREREKEEESRRREREKEKQQEEVNLPAASLGSSSKDPELYAALAALGLKDALIAETVNILADNGIDLAMLKSGKVTEEDLIGVKVSLGARVIIRDLRCPAPSTLPMSLNALPPSPSAPPPMYPSSAATPHIPPTPPPPLMSSSSSSSSSSSPNVNVAIPWTSPPVASPHPAGQPRTLQTSYFLMNYKRIAVTDQLFKVFASVHALIDWDCVRRGISELEGKIFFDQLQEEALKSQIQVQGEAKDIQLKFLREIPRVCQCMWTSALLLRGREFCSILNGAIRDDEPSISPSVVVIVRAINYLSVIRIFGMSSVPWPLNNLLYRGGGITIQGLLFFMRMIGKLYRVPMLLATSTEWTTCINTFCYRAVEDDKLLPVLYVINLHAISKCFHVNYIEKSRVENEKEFLFVPYSVFEVVRVEEREHPTFQSPHVIHLNAMVDNKQHPEDLPLAPWH